MKAITLWQPWASLVAIGAKKFETRSWATSYRGPIAIHAARKCPDYRDIPSPAHCAIIQALTPYARQRTKTTGFNVLDMMPRGAIVATAELVGCHEMKRNSEDDAIYISDKKRMFEHWLSPSDDEYLFGDWTPGRYAWELANVQMLSEPIPAKGKQGLWNWESEAQA